MKTLAFAVLAFAVLASTPAFAAAKTAPAAAKSPRAPAAVKAWSNKYGDGISVFSGKTAGGDMKWWIPADANTSTLYTKGNKIVRVVGQ